ncbi:MAG: ABC transporter ATP-binding protein [Planctomycetota bacterium]
MEQSNTKSFFRLVWPHALPRIPAILGVFVLGAMSTVGVAVALLLLDPMWPVLFPGESLTGGAAVDGGEPSSRTRIVQQVVDGVARLVRDVPDGVDPSRTDTLVAIAAILFLLAVVSGAANYGFAVLSRWVAFRMVIDLRLRLVRHLMGLSMRYHGRRAFGDVLSRISQDVQTTLLAMDVALKDLVQDPAEAAAFLAVAILYAPPGMWLVLIVVLPLVLAPIAVMSKKVRKRGVRSFTELGASVQVLSQMFTGIRTVKAFRAEQRELDAYEAQNQRYLSSSMKMVRAIAASRGLTSLFSLAGFGVIMLGLGFVIDGASGLEPSDLAIFVVSISQVYSRTKRITNTVTRVQESMAASHRLNALLDERTDVVDAVGGERLASLGSGIRLEDVHFHYVEEDGPAIDGVSLELRPGETLALVGASGSGKSTLMDLVARFIDPVSGRVSVDGRDLRDVRLDDWTSLYAMVDQAPFLFHASIRENIRYARPDASDADIEAAARAANIHEFVLSLPNGYDTAVVDGGARLSGGQRQRIAIARALLKSAPLLLLDEATSALDSESERSVQNALDTLMVGRTALVIAHRLSTIRGADRIAVLDRGKVIELGTHDELLAKGGTYARLHALQTAGA